MLEAIRGAWAQILSTFLGLWLMAAPAVLDYGGTAADVHRTLGPIAAAFAFVAVWGHMRPLRWSNVLVGGLLALAPLLFQFEFVAAVNSVVVGLAIVALSFVRGTVMEQYGGGWLSLWTGNVSGGDDGSVDR